MRYFKTFYNSPIGRLMLASDGINLIGLWIEGQKYYGGTILENLEKNDDLLIFNITKKWLDKYFTGQIPLLANLPLAPIGSDFRKTIWEILCKISYGETVTYGHIAKIAANKMKRKIISSQAVGGAVGHNPISIIIPCHRVIGAKGNLIGYAAGSEKKIKLLEIEKIDTSKLLNK